MLELRVGIRFFGWNLMDYVKVFIVYFLILLKYFEKIVYIFIYFKKTGSYDEILNLRFTLKK